MPYRRIALSAIACFAAFALFAEEPECAAHYRSDGKSAETFVLTGLTPQAVIERLPRMLIAAGASMQSSEPEKGTLKAEGLEVKADVTGGATRVTFRSSAGADKATLCRYASLVGNPPVPPAPPVAQDPALIARIKKDLIKRNQIVQSGGSGALNTATFTSPDDFLEFKITSAKELAGGDQRQYGISMLLPRAACAIASEDIHDGIEGFGGRYTEPRVKPVNVEASLLYTRDGQAWLLTEATISHIESTK